ncbi:hypothetical protein SLA2020_499910 [Shorea laevis]
MAMLVSIVVFALLLMLFLILLIVFLLVCKPWRFSFFSRSRTVRAVDLDRPLVSDDVDQAQEEGDDVIRNYDLGSARFQNDLRSARAQGLVHKQRFPFAPSHSTQGDSLILDVRSDASEDASIGQTIKHPAWTDQLIEEQKHGRQEDQIDKLRFGVKNGKFLDYLPKVIHDQRSCLSLEVVSGPSCGFCYSVLSTSSSKLPLTLGRVPPSDLLLKDSEVSGKHAMINWNPNKMKWELVDMGSLNGTSLNSQPINHPDSERRHWGNPMELSSGDIITLGTTSNIHVHISSQDQCQMPFGVGLASDPMALRRGGKKLPMEDVCYYQWPLPGVNQFGVFGICDGHGGAEAAKFASKTLPEMVATILSDSQKRERVMSQCDASDVLKDAFSQTEACMNHHYEGCTATVLLVWAADDDENFFAQCANVGDSACIINVDGQQIKMTEDHKITSHSERLRIQESGEPLKEGEKRLCGLNLARMLGDKFVKQQDSRFSSEPYISPAVHINKGSGAFALLASDGFWDVISVKKAVQLVMQTRERYPTEENSAENIANFLLSEARAQRTKDNTSIIFLDFYSASRSSSSKVDL